MHSYVLRGTAIVDNMELLKIEVICTKCKKTEIINMHPTIFSKFRNNVLSIDESLRLLGDISEDAAEMMLSGKCVNCLE